VIPRAHVTAWRATAPWPDDSQVEQDLVVSRALVDMFNNADLARAMAFRGGTALNKLFFERQGRYSEDIDLVQREAGPIGPAIDSIREGLDRWLGRPKYKRGHGRVALIYRFETTSKPVHRMRLKVEINTREHFAVFGCQPTRFTVQSPWFSGAAISPPTGSRSCSPPSCAPCTNVGRGATSSICGTRCPCSPSTTQKSSSVLGAISLTEASPSLERSTRQT